MSSYKVCDISNNNIVKASFDIKEVKKEIINNLYQLFKVKIIDTDFIISSNPNDYLISELIGYDESYRIVLFEFRKDKYQRLINNGLLICDYINLHPSAFKLSLVDKVDTKVYDNLVMKQRLVIIGEDYSLMDRSSIKELPYEIDLIKASFINNYLFINKLDQVFNI